MENLKASALILGAAAIGLTFASNGANAQPTTADVATIVDESGSMAGEHNWLPSMIGDLESGLQAAGVGNTPTNPANRYAKIGFGGHAAGDVPHKHQEGGSDWFSASQYDNDFVTSGGFEDGWNGIDFFLNNYSTRSDAALNAILVTDEDRDSQNGSLTKSGITSQLTGANALLNSVVNTSIECGDGSTALGVDSTGTGYVADGSGGFTTCSGASATGGAGSTVSDYVDLALDTGGAAWDLNQLRAGGNTATSFTNAFTDIKVQEIQQQPPPSVPTPAPLTLLGIGLAAMGATRRRMVR